MFFLILLMKWQLGQQEAQLLQTDCVMLHVIEYFTKSLEVI